MSGAATLTTLPEWKALIRGGEGPDAACSVH